MIKIYRKKPTLIQAIQLDGINVQECIAFMAASKVNAYGSKDNQELWSVAIPTLEGIMMASPGDFIVKGNSPAQGDHFWPVKPDYFALNYEDVEVTIYNGTN